MLALLAGHFPKTIFAFIKRTSNLQFLSLSNLLHLWVCTFLCIFYIPTHCTLVQWLITLTVSNATDTSERSYVHMFNPPSRFLNFQEAFEVANKISLGIMPIVYISIWDYTATGRNGFASLLHTHFYSQGFPTD